MAIFTPVAGGKNPHDYCPRCGTRFGVVEEICHDCGLDPVNDEEDSAFYEQAVQTWRDQQK